MEQRKSVTVTVTFLLEIRPLDSFITAYLTGTDGKVTLDEVKKKTVDYIIDSHIFYGINFKSNISTNARLTAESDFRTKQRMERVDFSCNQINEKTINKKMILSDRIFRADCLCSFRLIRFRDIPFIPFRRKQRCSKKRLLICNYRINAYCTRCVIVTRYCDIIISYFVILAS